MTEEYEKTQVMNVENVKPATKPSAAEVADKIQGSIDESSEPSSELQFTKTYSYLT